MNRHSAKILLVSIFAILVNHCSSQIIEKQVRIPLNNFSGVPYYDAGYGGFSPGIEGFDVDTAGNYYFLVGYYQKGATTLAVFNGVKQKYRKTYNTFFANRIIFHKNKIYVLDNSYTNNSERKIKNDFYKIDAGNGEIIKRQCHIIENRIDSYRYFDDKIVLWMFDTVRQVTLKTHYFFVLMNWDGKIIGKAKNQNPYDFPDSLGTSLKKTRTLWYYLGRWGEKGFFVFGAFDGYRQGTKNVENYAFGFEDKSGKFIGISRLDRGKFGKIFFGDEDLSWRICNGKIYVLGQDGKNALITELSVEELYKDAIQHPLDGQTDTNISR